MYIEIVRKYNAGKSFAGENEQQRYRTSEWNMSE